jgi:nitrogen fixation-related uncharacterized protein
LKWRFAIEFIACTIQPVPWASSIYSIGAKLLVLMLFLRCYLFLRILRDYSPVWIERRTLADGGEFDRPEYEVDSSTVFKTYFHTRPGVVLISIFSMIAVSLSYSMYLLEREWWEPKSGQFDYSATRSNRYPDQTIYDRKLSISFASSLSNSI